MTTLLIKELHEAFGELFNHYHPKNKYHFLSAKSDHTVPSIDRTKELSERLHRDNLTRVVPCIGAWFNALEVSFLFQTDSFFIDELAKQYKQDAFITVDKYQATLYSSQRNYRGGVFYPAYTSEIEWETAEIIDPFGFEQLSTEDRPGAFTLVPGLGYLLFTED